MPIPSEPIGSIPRSAELLGAMQALSRGEITEARFRDVEDAAVRETIKRFEETGSPVVTDGEQRKSSFATYPLSGLTNLAPGGVTIPFEDGHTRQLPKLSAGRFHYGAYAASYLKSAQQYAERPVKQAVISASALSLLYPNDGLAGYTREQFINDLVKEAQRDIRDCLNAGAACVQIDFTEGRLALKLDPSGGLLASFVELNNRVMNGFSADERQKIGVHTCPGGDKDSTHCADVDYLGLLPQLFKMQVGRFYVQLASEKDRPRVLKAMREVLKPGQILFVGVTDPINPTVESVDEVAARVREAAAIIPLAQLGTTDDCGFSPFADDTSTSRDTAFAKIKNRVAATNRVSKELGLA
jgi:5-methyltetrahydropteroyltriglutamate--homocysteine methyltransferase